MSRKIVEAPQEVWLNGASLVDGISIIYLAKDKNGNHQAIPGRSSARVNAEGDIYTSIDTVLSCKETDNLMDRANDIAIKIRKSFKRISLIMLISSLFFGFFAKEVLMRICSSMCFLTYGLAGFANNLALFWLRLKKDEDVLSLMRFHSAEHAVINAYNDLKRMPEYKELRFYSNYSYSCGTLQFASTLVAFTGFALVQLFVPGLWVILGHVLVLLITYLLYKENKLYFLESVVLIQPTSKEYKVALEALGIELTRAAMYETDQLAIDC